MGEDRHRRNDMGPWFIMPTPLLNLQFEHPEDRRFFIDLLTGGDEQKFEAEFLNCFDFREPAIKPKEFNALGRKRLGTCCKSMVKPVSFAYTPIAARIRSGK